MLVHPKVISNDYLGFFLFPQTVPDKGRKGPWKRSVLGTFWWDARWDGCWPWALCRVRVRREQAQSPSESGTAKGLPKKGR